jgi:S-adenosylmethionine:tRNA ribosyltransferase-isomerase
MQTADFDYELPETLIAQHPMDERTASRLLYVPRSGDWQDLRFPALEQLLRPGDLLVVNDTRVMPSRLFGRKASGGRIEMLLERMLGEREARVQLRASHAPQVGGELEFEGGGRARVLARDESFYVLEFDEPVANAMARAGHVPLPPYIKRPDTSVDRERYQTVYAAVPGAVAAPTAGLHFDEPLLGRLSAGGVELAMLTLHVGAGTFQPVREAQLASGRLHPERVAVPGAVVEAVGAARARGGRVVAVGTTVTRALESAAGAGELRPMTGETDLFIMPGFRFQVVDVMLTNFHLPRSSLLMLVCAFAGTEPVLAAYRHAVSAGYRFFSYGDAMLLERVASTGLSERDVRR